MPADLAACWAQRVGAPPPGALSRAQAARLIAELKREGDRLSACGRRLVAWYEGLAAGLAAPGAPR